MLYYCGDAGLHRHHFVPYQAVACLMNTPLLSIILINYKTAALTLACIASICAKEQSTNVELILVDNGSEDGLLEEVALRYPGVRCVQMGYNAGFARANNAGMRLATGQYILIHEPDSLLRCVRYVQGLDQRTVLGCRLVNPDGSYQETLRLEFEGIYREIRANALYILLIERGLGYRWPGKRLQYEAHQRTGPVAWINGAFQLFHRDLVFRDGLWYDEDFFLYGEDTEWCRRVSRHGYRFVHYHEVTIEHVGSASSAHIPQAKFQQVMASDWLYYRKAYGRLFLAVVLLIIGFNQLLDEVLYRVAKWRGRTFSPPEMQTVQYRAWITRIWRRYACKLLWSNTFSSAKHFDIDCYAKNQTMVSHQQKGV
jgi:GT2 family glycosyltransferase